MKRLRFVLPVLFAMLACAEETTTPNLPNAPVFGTRNYFKSVFTPPQTNIEMKPPVHLADYVVDGKIELSMRSYLDLVMSNNTDIAIQRLSIEVPRNQILRSYGAF